MPRFSLAFGVLPLLIVLVGCGGESHEPSQPRWIDLTEGFRPAPLEELAERLEGRLEPAREGRLVRRGAENEELWFELPLPRTMWTYDDAEKAWRCPAPTGGALLAGGRISMAVADGAEDLVKGRPRQERAGRFWENGASLYVTVAPDAEPTDSLVYRMRLEHGREVDGRWHVAQADLACQGILVFPGEAVELTIDIPAGSRLDFSSVVPDPGGHGEDLPPTTFSVALDGRRIFQETRPFARTLRGAHHRIDLETSGTHRLAFEVDGPAPAILGTPMLAPRTIGNPGARPWGPSAPDIVLVLCDTFRADNLAAWGGRAELAPRLNRFVEGSLRFLDVRSAAAWTLPSIASILSGTFPGQHGATDIDRGVAAEVETIAEVLTRQGYRTAAVTDSGLFSRHYGQDQGFQWFQETMVAHWSLNDTLARARQRIEADDGRPLFLVVHTYRVHGPMRTGPDEDLEPYQRVRVELLERMKQRQAEDPEITRTQVALEFMDVGKGFYDDAVADLDAKVGSWIEALQGAGFLAHGRIVLTADHGNSHGEHDQIGHGGDLYDVKLRVPLAIAGGDIEARAVAGEVSLIDLAPTLAAMAGVEPSPTWVGRSLLEARPEGPVYAFDLRKRHKQIALYLDGRKLMAGDIEALRAGEPTHAFDLAPDPSEDANLAHSMVWPGELGRTLAETLPPLFVPASGSTALELPPEILEQLKAIGYGE